MMIAAMPETTGEADKAVSDHLLRLRSKLRNGALTLYLVHKLPGCVTLSPVSQFITGIEHGRSDRHSHRRGGQFEVRG
jgi:hypothetical protein